tara:strand:+ start:1663 stop:1851 length:189 start_codon:yes stop_codon:yes gene_type:complete
MKNNLFQFGVNLLAVTAAILILFLLASFTCWTTEVSEWNPFVRFVYAISVLIVGFRTFANNA